VLNIGKAWMIMKFVGFAKGMMKRRRKLRGEGPVVVGLRGWGSFYL